ncbi:tetratricopeptide repeat protein, partial [bacterium]|nr:tetratricopeptide repeat protein [bacterium]
MNNTIRFIFLFLLFYIGCVYPQKQSKVGKIEEPGKGKSYNYYYHEGLKELNDNQYERAIELFSKGINLDHSNPEIFLQRGIAYYNRSKYDQSSSDMKQV